LFLLFLGGTQVEDDIAVEVGSDDPVRRDRDDGLIHAVGILQRLAIDRMSVSATAKALGVGWELGLPSCRGHLN